MIALQDIGKGPDDYWKSPKFCRRYTVNNINLVRENEPARLFNITCIPECIQRPRVDAEANRLACAQHATMPREHVPGFHESCMSNRHWIEPTDSITNIRGIYPWATTSATPKSMIWRATR